MTADSNTLLALVGLGVTQMGRLVQSWSHARRMRRDVRLLREGIDGLREAIQGIYRRVGRVESHLDLTPLPTRRQVDEDPLDAFDSTNHGRPLK